MKKTLLVSSLLLILTVGGVAYATGPGGHSFFSAADPGPMAMMRIAHQLDLRDDQMQYLENIHAIFAEVRDHHAEFAGGHASQVADKLASDEPFTVEHAHALVDQHLAGAQTVAYAVTEELTGFLNSLDDEQRAILSEHLNTVAERRAAAASAGGPGHFKRIHRILGALHP